jgi:hypothetical protein
MLFYNHRLVIPINDVETFFETFSSFKHNFNFPKCLKT